jgi:ABC-type multidrug transport system fused ATPase/permease subunit
MALGTLRSASNLHIQMLRRILHAPMSFFDTTPVGRIVNRFAKDVDVCDSTLPFNLRLWLNSFFSVVATLAIISYRYEKLGMFLLICASKNGRSAV